MYTTGQTYKLKPGCYEKYKKAHDELWSELAEAMRANEINMVIHHHEDRLYMYVTAPSEEHLKQSHASSKAQQWLEYMATMMITDESGKSVVEEMDLAFSFGAFEVGQNL